MVSANIWYRQEQDKETKMYREVYSRHKDFLDACVGEEFEMVTIYVLLIILSKLTFLTVVFQLCKKFTSLTKLLFGVCKGILDMQ